MLIPRNSLVQQTHLIPTSLSHAAGVITSVVNGVTRTVNLSSLVANTIYYIYLRNSGSSTIMEYNSNAPSTQRVSQPTSVLIGAFLSNGVTGSIAFGSFINIEGIPTSNAVFYTPTFTGLGTVTGITASYYIEGSRMKTIGRATAGTVSAANFQLSVPASISTPTSSTIINGELETLLLSTTFFKTHILMNNGDTFLNGGFKTSSSNGLIVRQGNELFVNAAAFSWSSSFETNDWSNTPLKDR